MYFSFTMVSGTVIFLILLIPALGDPVTRSLSFDKHKVSEYVSQQSTLVHREINNSGALKKLFSVRFEDIPTSLKDEVDLNVEYYAYTLVKERRHIQRLMLIHMTHCTVAALGAYLVDKSFLFPFVKSIVLDDEGRRQSLEETWTKHQQRVSDFVHAYLEYKNIPYSSLLRNHVGVKYVEIEVKPDHIELLPVYVEKKGDPLPPFTSEISSSASRILQNWWAGDDDLPN
ncbi:uncharacterized protein LOC128983370 [Macrosteles quadrilineatus]|uniref:uncharacterized protein LOC128983370 n=1 Tax=Macrosteles quadrilineatus TaxID=74068 RepID=UPI0023E22A6A|nr:uncharacterized protein LOC128983370 [Macrosteles quadrilineatus]